MEALVTPAGFGRNHSQWKGTFLVKSIDLLQALRAAALQTEMSICSSLDSALIKFSEVWHSTRNSCTVRRIFHQFIPIFQGLLLTQISNRLIVPWLEFSFKFLSYKNHIAVIRFDSWHCLHLPACDCMKYFLSRGCYCLCFGVFFWVGGKERQRGGLLWKAQPHNFRLITDMIALEYRDSNAAEPSFILSNCYLYRNSRILTPGAGRREMIGTRLQQCSGAKIQVLSVWVIISDS